MRRSFAGVQDDRRDRYKPLANVICVGKIRDEETAEIALRAAQTGHLVPAILAGGGGRNGRERCGAGFGADEYASSGRGGFLNRPHGIDHPQS